MPDTPLEVLVEELGAITGRMERDAGLRFAALETDLKRQSAEIESRILTLPPELAVEVARAVRILHEASPIIEHGERSAPSRVVRIERDEQGHLVPVYDN